MPAAGGSCCRCRGITPPARRWGLRGGGASRRGTRRRAWTDRVAIPGPPPADLVFVQAGLGLGDGEGLLDSPAASGDVGSPAVRPGWSRASCRQGSRRTAHHLRRKGLMGLFRVRATLAVLAGFVVLLVLRLLCSAAAVSGSRRISRLRRHPGGQSRESRALPGPGVVAQPFRAVALAAVFPGPAGNLGGACWTGSRGLS